LLYKALLSLHINFIIGIPPGAIDGLKNGQHYLGMYTTKAFVRGRYLLKNIITDIWLQVPEF
jgi:hypothetical protein